MSKLSSFALPTLLFFFPLLSDCAEGWRELKGGHFIVYHQGREEEAAAILRKAEDCYSEIADDLGYVRYENFWQWERRVKILVYPDLPSFLAATRQPGWSSGSANYTTKEIIGFLGSSAFLNDTLPHEIAHLVFRDFVGFAGDAPLWLDEGVAQWVERSKRAVVRYAARDLYEQKKLMSLSVLTRTDVRVSGNSEEARSFYIQAASLVEFLISRYGTDRFTQLCRQLRDGRSLDEALRFVYPTQMRGIEALETEWLAYLKGFRMTVEKTTGDRKEIMSYGPMGRD